MYLSAPTGYICIFAHLFVESNFKFPHICENFQNGRPSNSCIDVMQLPNGKECLFTDTVGFIQKLPTQLVCSFDPCFELYLPLIVEYSIIIWLTCFEYFEGELIVRLQAFSN